MPPFTSPSVTAALSPLVLARNARLVLSRRQQPPCPSRHAALLPSLFLRPSSMSAIVRGLRRTFRDPQGKRPPGHNPEVAAHVSERRRERQAAPTPTYRILRGKKDVTERPVPKAKTRRARFFDPEDEYGKKSLVYQLKSGALEAEVKALSSQQLQQQRGEEGEGGDERPFRRNDEGQARGGNRRDGRNSSYGEFEPRSRTRTATTSFGGRDGPRARQGVAGRRDRGGGDRWSDRGSDRGTDRETDRRSNRDSYRGSGRDSGRDSDRRPINRDRAPERRSEERPERRSGARPDRDRRQDYNRDNGRDVDRDNDRDIDRFDGASAVPLSIPYTTAASQFLYGRSVVEAALRSARRQLYKLYVYGGANRSGGAPQDQQSSWTIERIAKRRGVDMQVVDERWQRLLDKMSKGRPHNGYILEASPLPQPPLAALGPFTEGAAPAPATADGTTSSPFATGPGFKIEVGYQSREEASVNGASDFVPMQTPVVPAAEGTEGNPLVARRHYRPLVLLLDQVLDPGNLGAIVRSASFLGVSAVAVSKRSSATLTSVALKASAGAAEAMALFSVDAPATFLARSRAAGWKVYAAVPLPAGDSTAEHGRPTTSQKKQVLDLDGLEVADPLRDEACILVMGSEGEGLPRAIRREADVEVSIANRSGSNVVDSLNVSVATGLLCASFLKGATRSASGGAREVAGGAIPTRPSVEDDGVTKNDELNIF